MQENMQKALDGGPWFNLDSFFSVKNWESNFTLKESTLIHSVIWIRLSQLPIKFYDKSFLEKMGKKLEALLKIDTSTSTTLRERGRCGVYRVHKNWPHQKILFILKST
ncbi:hypothetical protein H5410_056931 [Solanum commersonii]|uniref:DUF4283 domain-containing protein n=1 Tax=Solanum commersonii TaxID=4109 RepID=A0A9J5WN71_SOLCO|nr:hypothetical protein H5410_056931 [Solanum commersonii]